MGGTPVPEDRKRKPGEAAPSPGLDFDRYVPWHKRSWFNRMRIAQFDREKAEALRALTFDALSALKWGKIAESNALADYQEYIRQHQPTNP